jgi:hypothetical protein
MSTLHEELHAFLGYLERNLLNISVSDQTFEFGLIIAFIEQLQFKITNNSEAITESTYFIIHYSTSQIVSVLTSHC